MYRTCEDAKHRDPLGCDTIHCPASAAEIHSKRDFWRLKQGTRPLQPVGTKSLSHGRFDACMCWCAGYLTQAQGLITTDASRASFISTFTVSLPDASLDWKLPAQNFTQLHDMLSFSACAALSLPAIRGQPCGCWEEAVIAPEQASWQGTLASWLWLENSKLSHYAAVPAHGPLSFEDGA